MITSRQRILWAGLLASATFAAAAQTPPPPAAPASGPARAEHRVHTPHDAKFGERMQARHAEKLGELKTELKLSASQEGAWTTFASSIQPPARPARDAASAQRPDHRAARAEFEKLTTPQRLDRMQTRQAERAAAFSKRADATRTFYAALTPEQQKTFDAQAMRHGPRNGHGPRGHGPRHGHGAQGPDVQRIPSPTNG